MVNVFKNSIALCLILIGVSFSLDSHAAINNAGILDNVLTQYNNAASSWAVAITTRATWLFWTLATISMVWTFGLMALRKADIGEFYAEFLKFTIFTGFFWWLLLNGPNFATDIISSLRTLGGLATGTTGAFTPSGIVDIGFDIFFKVLDQSSVWSPVDSAAGIIISAFILIILTLVGVNMLLLLISGWILAFAGVFFLGFGGSRWTSDIAIGYFKTVLNIAAQLFTMVLIVGIGKSFVDQYYINMSAGISLKEMGVMLVVSLVLLILVNRVPPLIGQIVFGGGASGQIGGHGAGAFLGAAGATAAAVAVGSSAFSAGATNIAGGAQALMAAASQASQNVANGSDIISKMTSGSTSSNNSGGDSTSPLAAAMGDTGGRSSGGGFGGAVASGVKKAVDTGANLAKGSMAVAKDKTKGSVGDTLGGKVAKAIKQQGMPDDTSMDTGQDTNDNNTEDSLNSGDTETEETGNSLSSASDETVDYEDEVAAFRDRDKDST